MKSTRERILQTLLTHPSSAISDLAAAVDINTISVRHHLTNLQAEGLIQASEERHGVGRPRLVYSLTDSGVERFPTRYLSLTNRLLDQLETSLPRAEINQLFERIATNIASEQAEKTKGLSIEKKLEILRESLQNEGFAIEWQKNGEGYLITETGCPFYHISHAHPEVCIMGQTLIASILNLPVTRVKSLLSGDVLCAFMVTNNTTEDKNDA